MLNSGALACLRPPQFLAGLAGDECDFQPTINPAFVLRIFDLIATSHSPAEAGRFQAFTPTDQQCDAVTRAAGEFQKFIGKTRVFGGIEKIAAPLSEQSNSTWDGHAWVQFGRHIIDTLIFRTACSSRSHPVLNAYVLNAYGDQDRVLITTYEAAARDDSLIYEPQSVLTEAQLRPIILNAFDVLITTETSID